MALYKTNSLFEFTSIPTKKEVFRIVCQYAENTFRKYYFSGIITHERNMIKLFIIHEKVCYF